MLVTLLKTLELYCQSFEIFSFYFNLESKSVNKYFILK